MALDVRDAWEDALAEGAAPADTATQLQRDLAAYADDEDDGPIFWFALAALQLEAGAVQPGVAKRAIDAIPASLARWREEGTAADYAERESALEELRRQLGGNAPNE